MTHLYSKLASLSLRVDRYDLAGRDLQAGPNWTRHTTLVQLYGAGAAGKGEDVNYDSAEQLRFQALGPVLDLTGDFTLRSFSAHLDQLDLWYAAPRSEASRSYRRWAFESAALDLALRQAQTHLGAVLGRSEQPLRFVASLGSDCLDRVRAHLVRDPDLRFKVDAGVDWDAARVAALAATGAIETVDLKGAYHGTPVDLAPDPDLYARVLDAFPNAWIEDPGLAPETQALCEKARDRLTWDAPLHSLADVEALPWKPPAINIKPSRFGTLAELLRVYAHCASSGIQMYGGGQFELDAGRDQIQRLAALFHPEGPNDTAPREFNEPAQTAELPTSPLRLGSGGSGFPPQP